jgi:carbamoyl-phosphate synthase large subunit
MHGCSNDFIIVNCFDMNINSPESLSVFLSDRHTGIGSEGIVLILRSETDDADAKIRIFDLDGSEDTTGGNAIRCAAKYLHDNSIVEKLQMRIETRSGVKELYLSTRNGEVSSVKVDMGHAELLPEKIPVNMIGESVINSQVRIGGDRGGEYWITCVSMGNPHAVVFCETVDRVDLHYIGPLFEHDPLFPDRVNVEFAEVMSRSHLKVRVWERGTGETQACGTGACTAVVAAVLNGFCDKGTDIKVQLPGGDLIINYNGETVYMTGNCVKIFDGVVEI